MSAFSQLVASQRHKPARVADVPMSVWADEYADRPKDVVLMGLRLLSESDIETARAEAARSAWQMHSEEDDAEGRTESYNDGLIRWAVSRALCQPDDATATWFAQQEDEVSKAFTPEGLRYLYEQIELAHVAASPLVAEANDDDVARLATILEAGDGWTRLNVAGRRAARRFLKAALELLEPEPTE